MANGNKISDIMGSFTAIPNSVYMLAPELGGATMLVYLHLSHRRNAENKCWPGYDEIQEYTGLGRKTISNALEKLIEYGLIKKSRRFGNSTIYELVYSSSVGNYSSDESDGNTLTVVPVETALVPVETALVPTGHANKNQLTRLNEQDDIPAHLRLSDAFTRAASMAYFGNDLEWTEAVEDMANAGITEEDITDAVKYCLDNGYTIKGPQSVKKAANIAMSRRVNGNGHIKKSVASEVF